VEKTKCVCLFLLLMVSVVLQPICTAASEGLSEHDFQDPPSLVRPRAMWCWLNGNVSLDHITRELDEMKDKGMGGADIWDVHAGWCFTEIDNEAVPAGPEFMGPESVKAITHAVNEAGKRDLILGMFVSSGWNAGGKWVTPENAGKALHVTEVIAEGPARLKKNLPFPENKAPKGSDGLPLYYKDVATIALPYSKDKIIAKPSAVVDLSDKMDKQGNLTWDVPAGKWVIMRLVCTNTGKALIVPSPNSAGLMIDFLDSKATEYHFQYFIDKLLASLGGDSFDDKALKYLHTDSMEMDRSDLWADNMTQGFEQAFGYDLVPYIPCMYGWKMTDKETSDRFLYDFLQFRSNLLIHSHYVTGSEVLAKYGLKHQSEAGGPGPPIWKLDIDSLKALGAVHLPMGEFWIEHRNMFLIKEISSAAHAYGRRIIDAESFTSGLRWVNGPFDYKKVVDRAFCEGLNRVTYHTFDHSPVVGKGPGWSYHWGSDIDLNTAWWPSSRPFHNYIARCSYMLSSGLFAADVCYYYGDQVPNFYPQYHDVPKKIIPEGLGQGYDYDVVNSQVILERMDVKDGNIVLPDGMTYRVLVLPNQDHMPLEVLQKLAQMVKKGATIIGPKPATVPGLVDYRKKNETLTMLADNMWGDCDGGVTKQHRYGKGTVFCGLTEREVLQSRNITPDFSYDTQAPYIKLDYIHRRTADEDWYFVRNMTDGTVETDCVFRVKGKTPEFWDPDTGRKEACMIYEERELGTKIPLRLGPAGSVFVVFRDKPVDRHVTSVMCSAKSDVPESLYYHSNTADGTMWLSEGNANGQWIIFDLAKPCDLEEIRIWNYNEARQGLYNRGVKDLELFTSADNVDYQSIGKFTLKPARGDAYEDFSQCLNVQAKDIRYVKLAILSNHSGSDKHRAGLSEVKFYGDNEIPGVTVKGVSSQRVHSSWRQFYQRHAANLVNHSGMKPKSRATYAPSTVALTGEKGEFAVLAAKPGTYQLRMSDGKAKRIEVKDVPDIIEIAGPWQVNFPKGWAAPTETTFDRLMSWTDSPEDGIKYFSGSATYHKDLHIPAAYLQSCEQMMLDLGQVGCVADVSINGKSLGTLWKSPYAIDIKPHVRPGQNTLTVKVTNTWSNRMLGDQRLPREQKYCYTNMSDFHRYSWNSFRMVDSGLIGPVKIHPVVKMAIE